MEKHSRCERRLMSKTTLQSSHMWNSSALRAAKAAWGSTGGGGGRALCTGGCTWQGSGFHGDSSKGTFNSPALHWRKNSSWKKNKTNLKLWLMTGVTVRETSTTDSKCIHGRLRLDTWTGVLANVETKPKCEDGNGNYLILPCPPPLRQTCQQCPLESCQLTAQLLYLLLL